MTPHEAASYWFVRHDSQEMTPPDRQAFEHWLAASEVHRRAYEQTIAMWSNFVEAAEESELRALRVAALTAAPMPKVWPRAIAVALGIGAVAGLASLLGNVSTRQQPNAADAADVGASRYATTENQRSTVVLSDGTSVWMNIGTVFEANFSATRRSIHLTRGQAFFEVAKDTQRPFVVAAADRQIRALGTKFDVRLDANLVQVVLVEGRVSVDRKQVSLLEKAATRSMHVELRPGQQLVAAAGESPSIKATNIQRATAWREGWIIFEDETVEQAIAELNRYAHRPILVTDEAVKRMRLSGVFRIGQPDRFGAIIQELLPISAEQGLSGETVLTSKP